MSTYYDPWVNVRTRHGLPADEVISTIQKEIRRGNEENACMIAFEMLLTSPDLEKKLWERLQVISVEDIGFADPTAPIVINTLYQQHLMFGRGEGDRLLFAIHAVRYLCSSEKDRSTDEMLNWFIHLDKEGLFKPEIPEYAIDMHTARGQEMGRGVEHFLTVGAQVVPEWEERDDSYRQKLLSLFEKK